ncbi:7667_t:CDS:1, partial [Cetraspora pellucida]
MSFKLYVIKKHAESKDHADLYEQNEIIKVLHSHVLSLMKIVYCMTRNNIALNKFEQLVHLGYAIESPNLISKNNSIIYKNRISRRELLSAIS